jgi:hypothetical protein
LVRTLSFEKIGELSSPVIAAQKRGSIREKQRIRPGQHPFNSNERRGIQLD